MWNQFKNLHIYLIFASHAFTEEWAKRHTQKNQTRRRRAKKKEIEEENEEEIALIMTMMIMMMMMNQDENITFVRLNV